MEWHMVIGVVLYKGIRIWSLKMSKIILPWKTNVTLKSYNRFQQNKFT